MLATSRLTTVMSVLRYVHTYDRRVPVSAELQYNIIGYICCTSYSRRGDFSGISGRNVRVPTVTLLGPELPPYQLQNSSYMNTRHFNQTLPCLPDARSVLLSSW